MEQTRKRSKKRDAIFVLPLQHRYPPQRGGSITG